MLSNANKSENNNNILAAFNSIKGGHSGRMTWQFLNVLELCSFKKKTVQF